jgi:hypothetical protein
MTSKDPEDDQGGGTGQLGEGGEDGGPAADDPGGAWRGPRAMVRAVTDPDWQAASQALDELMGKLIVLHRLLAAEQRLPRREPRADPM